MTPRDRTEEWRDVAEALEDALQLALDPGCLAPEQQRQEIAEALSMLERQRIIDAEDAGSRAEEDPRWRCQAPSCSRRAWVYQLQNPAGLQHVCDDHSSLYLHLAAGGASDV